MAAPAPGSPEEFRNNLTEGARGDWVPSPATRIGAQGGKEVRKFYADIHRTKKYGDGFRITYTTDGITFRHVDDFTDIPVNAGDKLFVDVLPIQHTDGAIELIRRGVEVYYLRRLTLFRKKREELKLPKTARGDIKVLMSLEERWFRRVSEDFLVMRRLICTHRTMMKVRLQLINKTKALSERESGILQPAIKAVEEQMEKLAREIAEEAGRRYPAYGKLVEELGILGKNNSMEALAELMPYLDFPKGFLKLCNLLGLFKPVGGRKKIYHGHLRRALQRLTASVNNVPPFQLTARMQKQTLHKIWMRCRQETLVRLAIPAQG